MVFGDMEEKAAAYKKRLKALGETVSDGEDDEDEDGEEEDEEGREDIEDEDEVD